MITDMYAPLPAPPNNKTIVSFVVNFYFDVNFDSSKTAVVYNGVFTNVGMVILLRIAT